MSGNQQSGRPKFHHLTGGERKACFSLALIVALRMFGLFMIFPVLGLYLKDGSIEGLTDITLGIAIGIYGLTQGLFQIPFGMLSDHYGRKRLIVIGLCLFIIGSVVAASSSSIWGIILGRVIQGCGAIAAVIMALAADLTREEVRTKAMAIIGATIGISILASFVIGPMLNKLIGIYGIFWMTAFFATCGLFLILYVVPEPDHLSFHRDTETVPKQIKKVFNNGQLNRYNIGIFFLHVMFAACFVVFPTIFGNIFTNDSFVISEVHYGFIYLIALSASMLIMIPMIVIGERLRRMKEMFLLSILFLIASHFILSTMNLNISLIGIANPMQTIVLFSIMLIVFFGAFNFLEAALPSLVSKACSPENKGTAMGVYSSFQYFGTFVGGIMGGVSKAYYGITGVYIFCLSMAVCWFLIAMSMQSPRYLKTQLLNVGPLDEKEAKKMVVNLTSIQGVAEAIIVKEEGVAYLKVDSKALDEEALFMYSKSTD